MVPLTAYPGRPLRRFHIYILYIHSILIEEGFIQKTRQTVVVSVWGARSYAAMGIFVLNVQYCVHVVLFPLLLWGRGGDALCVDLYFKYKDIFNYFIFYFIC